MLPRLQTEEEEEEEEEKKKTKKKKKKKEKEREKEVEEHWAQVGGGAESAVDAAQVVYLYKVIHTQFNSNAAVLLGTTSVLQSRAAVSLCSPSMIVPLSRFGQYSCRDSRPRGYYQ
nr:unnamed protein product [Spirometra erinaceieuropaei]